MAIQQVAGAALLSLGTLSKMLGKDMDYPVSWSAVKIVNGQAVPMTNFVHSLDTNNKQSTLGHADALSAAQAFADHINNTLDTLELTPEQRSQLNTEKGITVGIMAGDRPGAVSQGGYFFGYQDAGDGFMSGITGGNQGFTTAEEALTEFTKFAFDDLVKPSYQNVDWAQYSRDNPVVNEEYEDYVEDQREEGRSYMGRSAWTQREYSNLVGRVDGWPVIDDGMDPELRGKLTYAAQNTTVDNLGLQIEIPEKYQDGNVFTRLGKIAQFAGSALYGINPELALTNGVLLEAGVKTYLGGELLDNITGGTSDTPEQEPLEDDEALEQILHNIDNILLSDHDLSPKSPQLSGDHVLSDNTYSPTADGVQTSTSTESSVEQVESSGPEPTSDDAATPNDNYGDSVDAPDTTASDVLDNTSGTVDEEVLEGNDQAEAPTETNIVIDTVEDVVDWLAGLLRTDDGTVIGDATVGGQTGTTGGSDGAVNTVGDIEFQDIDISDEAFDPNNPAVDDNPTNSADEGEPGTIIVPPTGGGGDPAEPVPNTTSGGVDIDPDIDLPEPEPGPPTYGDLNVNRWGYLSLEPHRKKQTLLNPFDL